MPAWRAQVAAHERQLADRLVDTAILLVEAALVAQEPIATDPTKAEQRRDRIEDRLNRIWLILAEFYDLPEPEQQAAACLCGDRVKRSRRRRP
jgi:predicted secreted protein